MFFHSPVIVLNYIGSVHGGLYIYYIIIYIQYILVYIEVFSKFFGCCMVPFGFISCCIPIDNIHTFQLSETLSLVQVATMFRSQRLVESHARWVLWRGIWWCWGVWNNPLCSKKYASASGLFPILRHIHETWWNSWLSMVVLSRFVFFGGIPKDRNFVVDFCHVFGAKMEMFQCCPCCFWDSVGYIADRFLTGIRPQELGSCKDGSVPFQLRH